MSYYITESCISCGACEPKCPNQAIADSETIYVIDPERCTECVGSHYMSLCAEVCPVDACHPDPEYKETAEQLLEKWRRLHAGETPVSGTYRA